MNWAHRLIHHSQAENHVSALLYAKNDFDETRIKFHKSPLQNLIGDSKNEWKIKSLSKAYKYIGLHYHISSIRTYIKQNNIQIIHLHFGTLAAKFIPLLKSADTQTIISFYGYDYQHAPFIRPHLKNKYQSLYKESTLLLSEGQNGRQILINDGCPDSKISVLHLGVDLNNTPTKKHSKASGSLHLFQPASFTLKKAQLDTLMAFQPLASENPNLKLTFVGEPLNISYYNQCQSFIDQYELQKQVKIKPFISYTTWWDEISKYDVIIQPSRYSHDMDCEGGAPVVLLDAQASGKPVISTFHCDIPEAVDNGKTGMLVEEGDIQGLRIAIKAFLEMDDAPFGDMSLAAKGKIERDYNIINSARQLDKIYAQLTI